MIRLLSNAIVRLMGWTPNGRRIRFSAGEGPVADELMGRLGEILELCHVGPQSVEILIVRLEEPVKIGEGKSSQLMLIPRHRGYGAAALCTTGIATYVFPAEHQLPDVVPDQKNMIGLVDISLCR